MRLDRGTYADEDAGVAVLASERGDLDNDGDEDLAALLVVNSKGSGVFYYLNVFLSVDNGAWQLAGEEFLGDRIAPGFLAIKSGKSADRRPKPQGHSDGHAVVVVSFSRHAPDQPFTEAPAIGVSREWRIVDARLVAAE